MPPRPRVRGARAGVPLFSGRLLEPFVLAGVQPYANGTVQLTHRSAVPS